MGIAYNSSIVTSGLVLALDAANTKNYNLTAVEVLVVAGGGGGGAHHGGGGGGGGLIYSNSQSITPGSAITVTVGNGGTGTLGGVSSQGGTAGNGGNSVFGALTAIGGGGGGNYPGPGANGGSGGGTNNWSTSTTGGTGTSGQGFAGGSNNGTTNYGGGGGGAGGTAKGLSNNSGGDGLPFNISGTVTYYSGGGGSGVYPGYTNDTSYGFGGLGGGGNGGNGPHGSGTNSTAGGTNTGGGGGGVADYTKNGAAGGSGIVIVRYPGPQKAIGGTVTSNNGYTIHTFTTSTTFIPLVATNNSAILGLSDLSGRGNFGTTVNSPTYSSSGGGSLVFDGTNDWVSCSSNPSYNVGTGDFSVFCWMKSNNKSNYQTIMTLDDAASGSGILFYTNAGDGVLRTWIGGSVRNGSIDICNNVWNFVGTTRISGTVTHYINSISNGTYIASGSVIANQNLRLGSYDGSGYMFNGNISNTTIYNRALTAAEVSQNYNALKSRYI